MSQNAPNDVVTLKMRMAWVDGMSRDQGLSKAAFRIAAAIGSRIDRKTGEAFPSLETIAKDSSTSSRTAWNAIQELEAAGYLIVKRRELGFRATDGRKVCGGRGIANSYSIGRIRPLNVERDHGGSYSAESSQPAATFANDKGGNSGQERSQFSTGKVAAGCHPTLSSTHIEPVSPSSAYGARSRQVVRQIPMLLPLKGRGLSEKERTPRRFAQGKFELELAQRLGLGRSDWVDDLARLPAQELERILRRQAAGMLDEKDLHEINLQVTRAKAAAVARAPAAAMVDARRRP